MLRIGIDVGSTTAKLVAIDETGEILFSKYERHHAKEIVINILKELLLKRGDLDACIKITGSEVDTSKQDKGLISLFIASHGAIQ